MTSRETLQHRLRHVCRRMRGERMLKATVVGFCMAGGVIVIWLLAADPAERPSWRWVLGGPPLAAFVAACLAALRPIRLHEAARRVDAEGGLKDRIKTAWFLLQKRNLAPVDLLQIEDAAGHLVRLRLSDHIPWRLPRWTIAPVLLWGVIGWVVWQLPEPQAIRAANVERQRQAQAEGDAMAEQVEQDLMSELRELAELTGTPSPDRLMLAELERKLRDEIDRMREQQPSREATLESLSAIQQELTQASDSLQDPALTKQLAELAQILGTAAAWQDVQRSLERGELEEAANQLDQVDVDDLTDLERRTVAEDLASLAKDLRETAHEDWADAIEQLQRGLSDADDPPNEADAVNANTPPTDTLSQRLRDQAVRMAIQFELSQQVVALADAKGQGSHGGDNTDASEQSRETWGRGRAGDPLSGDASELATTRRRETLTGQMGEGPTDRQVTQSDRLEGTAARTLEQAVRPTAEAVEQALAAESLPLGRRQMVRRYFEAIREE